MRRSSDSAARPAEERDALQLYRLYGFMRRLSRPFDSATYAWLLRKVASQVNARTGSLAVYRDDERALAIVATLGYAKEIVEHVRIESGVGVLGEVFATGRPLLQTAQPGRRVRYATTSFLVVPLITSDGVLGVIALTDREDRETFDDADLATARLWAAPAALAIARERVRSSLAELTRDAAVDPVTGLFNRRHFEARLEGEVQRGRRQQQELALLMVDIDDFKRINDTFGHLEGDRALRDVADLLRDGVRIFDVCARFGGEEFAILMPGASASVATQIAERIRQGVQERFRTAPSPAPITVSIGVGVLGLADSAEEFVASADRALIAAKRAGKNVVKTDHRGHDGR